jgi:GT2 family glycosyltransferase
MGVIKARNLGYERADGEIMITIDDDAVFSSPQVTANAVKALEETSAKIVAMKVINNYSGEIEFPPNGSDLQDRIPLLRPQTDLEQSSDSYRMTTLFTGCANAIHQDVLDDIGRYPPSYDYGVEEFDLSLRAIDAGFDIVYCPNCVVIHYEEPDGRFEDDKIQKELFKNRIATSLRNHPIRYIVLSWCIWSARLLFRSGGNVKLYLISNFELYEEFSEILENRNKISRDTIERIRELGGRIF